VTFCSLQYYQGYLQYVDTLLGIIYVLSRGPRGAGTLELMNDEVASARGEVAATISQEGVVCLRSGFHNEDRMPRYSIGLATFTV